MVKDWQELEAIDLQLTQQEARYPVYEWVYKPDWPIRAKFEQFLSGKKDFNDEGFDDPLAREGDLESDRPDISRQSRTVLGSLVKRGNYSRNGKSSQCLCG